jgi:hypothetical protein
VAVFDAIQPGQQIALLALVSTALSDAAVPASPLKAATEGALAAAFAQVRAGLKVELDAGDKAECPTLILSVIGDDAGRDGPLLDAKDTDWDEWDLLIEEVEVRHERRQTGSARSPA